MLNLVNARAIGKSAARADRKKNKLFGYSARIGIPPIESCSREAEDEAYWMGYQEGWYDKRDE